MMDSDTRRQHLLANYTQISVVFNKLYIAQSRGSSKIKSCITNSEDGMKYCRVKWKTKLKVISLLQNELKNLENDFIKSY